MEMSTNEIIESSDDDMEDEFFRQYYDHDTEEGDPIPLAEDDVESFEYELLRVEDVERLLNETVEALCKAISVQPALAKVLLHTQKWSLLDIVREHKRNPKQLLSDCRIHPLSNVQEKKLSTNFLCPVCMQKSSPESIHNLSCGHAFCSECWQTYFQYQIQYGHSTAIECMGKGCNILVPEDFVQNILTNSNLRDKYQEYAFKDHVKSHPELRFCPGPNCPVIVQAKENKAKRVICTCCNTSFWLVFLLLGE